MNATPKSPRRVALDWSRLLGFDQVDRSSAVPATRLTDRRLARLGAKVGAKPVVKS